MRYVRKHNHSPYTASGGTTEPSNVTFSETTSLSTLFASEDMMVRW